MENNKDSSKTRSPSTDETQDNRFLSQKKAQLQAKKDSGKKSRDKAENEVNRNINNSSTDRDLNDSSKLISQTPQTLGKTKKGVTDKDTTQNRTSKSVAAPSRSVNIPQFYFPTGRPIKQEESEAVYKNIKEAFTKFESQRATKANMLALTKVGGSFAQKHFYLSSRSVSERWCHAPGWVIGVSSVFVVAIYCISSNAAQVSN